MNLKYKEIHISTKQSVANYTETYIHKVVLYQCLFWSIKYIT